MVDKSIQTENNKTHASGKFGSFSANQSVVL